MLRAVRSAPRMLLTAILTLATLALAPATSASEPPPSADGAPAAAEAPRARLPAPPLAPGHPPDASAARPDPAPSERAGRLPPVSVAPGAPPAVHYRELIRRSAEATGAEAAIIAALMEVEGSGERAVSPAGARGLMQLMPDKFRPGDDPFDPATNLLRAAEHIRRLQDRWGAPERVAAAYFGAIDHRGNVTDASDGNVDGHEYVARFRAAYGRYAGAP